MISQCGIALFIFGNKKSNEEIIIADGMLMEFKIAKELKKIIIPVGSTGSAALKIYEEVKENITEYPYLGEYLNDLETETDWNKLIKLITKIINNLQII